MQTHQSTSFFGTLFDFSFSHFITSKFVKLIYAAIVMISGAIWGVIALGALFTEGLFAFVGAAIFGTLMFFLSVIAWRIFLELIVVIFRIADHLRDTATAGSVQ